MTEELKSKLHHLREVLGQMESAIIAFSGGVDSSLVLKVATEELHARAIGVIAISPSLPKSELDDAQQLGQQMGARLEFISTNEVSDASYAANPPNRCFFCKDHVYQALRAFGEKHGVKHLLDGMNADDTLDAGRRAAAAKHGVRSPLHELGFTKADVRDAARALGLLNWDKPAAACLSSRISYGTSVTTELLSRIEAAEAYVRSLGFRELRVRHHGDVVRVEVSLEAMPQALAAHGQLAGGLKALGWLYVTLDLEGLRTGSMNEALRRTGGKTTLDSAS